MSDPSPPAPAAPDDGATARGSLAGPVRVVASLTLLSRVFGLARDVLLARVFGASAIASSVAAALAIPNLFRRLLGEGALSAAFLPEYAAARRDHPDLAPRLAFLTLALLLGATGAIVLAAEVVLLVLLGLLPGDPDRDLSLRLLMLTLPYMPLVCASAILAGMLQVHGRFAGPAAGPILLNAFVIAACLWYLAGAGDGSGDRTPAAFIVCGATVAAGLAQVLWFGHALRAHLRFERAASEARAAARRMIGRFLPAVVGAGTVQINTFLDTALAMWPIWVGPTMLGLACPLDDDSNSILSFTQRLYQFPLGVFGIAVATAVFPVLARRADDDARFAETLRHGLRLSFFIALPASLGLVLVREDLVRTVFGAASERAGEGFDAEALARSAFVLAGYAPGVWAFSLNHVLARAFYARGDTRTPMRVSLVFVGANLTLNLALIWPLGESGLAWSTSACAIAQFVVLSRLASIRLGAAAFDRATRLAFARTAVAALGMAACVGVLPGLATTWRGHAVSLSIALGVGVAAYLIIARLSRLPELRWLLSRDTD